MSAATESLLGRLNEVRNVGDHKWQARCPAHDDNRASLSVSESDDGKVLLHCHANCTATDVVGAVGMKMSDLFPGNGHTNGKPAIVAEYDYRNADGNLIFQAIRFAPKDFRQRRPKAGGGWEWSVKGCPTVPYRLPELMAADASATIFVVEGEKDVDRLRAIGVVATCNAGGAGKWRKEHAKHLERRNVVILPDNDAAGRKHAEQVAASLAGVAASVKVVELPELPAKGDVSDWLDGGHTADELFRLAEAADNYKPEPKTHNAYQTIYDSPAGRHATDVGNCERFAAQHGADVRFCHEWRKWLTWDGRRWAMENSGEVMRRAKLTARSIFVEAANASTKKDADDLARWAIQSERRERLAAMLALAESEQPIPAGVEVWDAEPWLLNVENGTLDLRTGELRPHSRSDFLTKLCNLEYPTEAGCDPVLWLQFLDRIFDGNAKLIQFLQRLAGMCLVGEIFENLLPIFHGTGQNGKSVFIETLTNMLGADYAMAAPDEFLVATKNDRHPTEIASLFGKRLVAVNETADGGRLSENKVKRLTSRERLRARFCGRDFFEFTPTHSLLLATNHRPIISGTDTGIWRRLRLVPFDVTIPEHERDRDLPNKLEAEWPLILRWAVAGCRDWQRNGLQEPPEVLEATSSYRSESDVLGEFLDECCLIGKQYSTPSSLLYKTYRSWAENRGENVETQTSFGLRLKERGYFSKRRVSGKTHYFGLTTRE